MHYWIVFFLMANLMTFSHAFGWQVVLVEGDAFISYPEDKDKLDRATKSLILRPGAVLVTGDNGRLQLSHESVGTIALARLSALQLRDGNQFYLARGSGLWDIQGSGARVGLEGKLVNLSLKRGTFMCEATAVGGLKLINLGKKMKINGADGRVVRLRAGELVFARTGNEPFSRVISIYLKELLATSELVRLYAQNAGWRAMVDAYAQLQYDNLIGISEAFVGDAVSDEDVELYVKEQ